MVFKGHEMRTRLGDWCNCADGGEKTRWVPVIGILLLATCSAIQNKFFGE